VDNHVTVDLERRGLLGSHVERVVGGLQVSEKDRWYESGSRKSWMSGNWIEELEPIAWKVE
jgi:hypothetical protein